MTRDEPAKPRVCLLTESFYPIVGGGEVHARQLSEALIERSVPVLVVTQRRPAGVPHREVVGRVPVERVASGGSDRWGKYLMLPTAFLHLIRRRSRYDVIYVCGMRTLGLPALLAGGLLGKPVVLRAESRTEMSGEYALDGAPGWLRPLVTAALGLRNMLYLRAAAFVSISDDLTAEFVDSGVPEERITTILNGVDTSVFRPAAPGESAELRARIGLPDDALIVVYTGKLNRGKGLEMLLRAWARLTDGGATDMHLVLVGGGANQFLSCESELRDHVRSAGLGSVVTFTGYVTGVADYLRAADVFTLPSDSEALPISLLEALACALPAVVTETGGMPEVVRDGVEGRLVAVGNEDGLIQALEELLTDPVKRQEMGAAGRRTVEQRFAIGAVAEAHEHLFRNVIESGETG